MYTCPVCNGFTTILQSCPNCHHLLQDQGRFMDFFGDYSPYQEIELSKRSDGWIDLKNHLCPHQLYCSHCGHMETKVIPERS